MILVDTSVWIDHLNADVHMSTDLKKTKCGNLFVIFGEPAIEVVPATDDRIQVKIKGVDLFDPRTGAIRSSETERPRLLVHRYRLRHGQFLRSSRLLPWRE